MEKALKAVNIIANRQLIPGDIQSGRHYQNSGGLRIGTSEITRLDMKKNDMVDVAEFIKRIVVDKEDPRKSNRKSPLSDRTPKMYTTALKAQRKHTNTLNCNDQVRFDGSKHLALIFQPRTFSFSNGI